MMTEFVTPYLPTAVDKIRNWVNTGKPAFHRCIQQPTEFLVPNSTANACKNCAGVGTVFVSLCLLPKRNSPIGGKKAGLWFDGNAHFYQGWYEIFETLQYECPHCKGTGRDSSRLRAAVDTSGGGR